MIAYEVLRLNTETDFENPTDVPLVVDEVERLRCEDVLTNVVLGQGHLPECPKGVLKPLLR